MIGLNYPVSEYYRNAIVDGVTITRSGGWWTAVLLLEDPKSTKPFVNLYSWQQVEGVWKNRKSFKIRSTKSLRDIVDALKSFESKLS